MITEQYLETILNKLNDIENKLNTLCNNISEDDNNLNKKPYLEIPLISPKNI